MSPGKRHPTLRMLFRLGVKAVESEIRCSRRQHGPRSEGDPAITLLSVVLVLLVLCGVPFDFCFYALLVGAGIILLIRLGQISGM